MEEIMVFQAGDRKEGKTYQGMCQYSSLGEVKRAILCHRFSLFLIHLDERREEGEKLAAYIREIPRHYLTPIIFFASDDTYERWAFHQIHCYDYLIKPVSSEKMLKIVYPLLLKTREERREDVISFVCKDTIRTVSVDNLIYLMADNHLVQVHTVKDTFYASYLCLNRFARQYEADFVQCHRAIVVNRFFVQNIDYTKRRIFVPETTLEMGRSFVKYIRKEFDGKFHSLYNESLYGIKFGTDKAKRGDNG